MKKIMILLSSLFLLGCGSTRVVFVDTQSNLVRIGPNVEGKWVLSKNKVKLPEGWYAGGIPQDD